jgi:hypothetical protein
LDLILIFFYHGKARNKHGKRKIICFAFGEKGHIASRHLAYLDALPPPGGLIIPCGSVKNPWLKNCNIHHGRARKVTEKEK